MKTKTRYDEAVSVSEADAPIGAHMVVTKVVREHVPIEAGMHGGTIGQLVDEMLLRAAQDGEEVQSIELGVTPGH